nr:centrosomal protein of 170 kDa protein B-like [Pongo pygmaeus]
MAPGSPGLDSRRPLRGWETARRRARSQQRSDGQPASEETPAPAPTEPTPVVPAPCRPEGAGPRAMGRRGLCSGPAPVTRCPPGCGSRGASAWASGGPQML